MSAEAVHLLVQGRVQGVFFRASTEKKAVELGLSGWVRNCEDGSVEVHAEGDRENLDQFIAWCRKGPPLAKVNELDVNWISTEGLKSFEVR